MRDRTKLKAFDEDECLKRHVDVVAGFDEAGRGPLCGPVVSGGVVLPKDFYCPLIDDSKKLSAKERAEAASYIKANALAWAVAYIGPSTIDRINILEASRLGMEQCLIRVRKKIDVRFAITDYMKLHTDIDVLAIPKGDATSEAVAAASILAKTARDRYMESLERVYPGYGFKSHKGYPTKAHLDALASYGIIEGLYRLTYKPVIKILDSKGFNPTFPPCNEDYELL